jgi:hypothetical protein
MSRIALRALQIAHEHAEVPSLGGAEVTLSPLPGNYGSSDVRSHVRLGVTTGDGTVYLEVSAVELKAAAEAALALAEAGIR